MRRSWPIVVAGLLALAGCGEPPSGFISLQSSVFLGEGDRLSCGSLDIRPKPNGLVSGFYAVPPGPCDLTLHARDSFFGSKVCELTVAENRITSVYLTRRGGALGCSVS